MIYMVEAWCTPDRRQGLWIGTRPAPQYWKTVSLGKVAVEAASQIEANGIVVHRVISLAKGTGTEAHANSFESLVGRLAPSWTIELQGEQANA